MFYTPERWGVYVVFPFNFFLDGVLTVHLIFGPLGPWGQANSLYL